MQGVALFGHRFAQRCGHGEKRKNFHDTQRSPIFIQFADCVSQLLHQFPTEFEFNEFLLSELVEHIYSCRFGTFLLNNDGERTKSKLSMRTQSLWSFLLHDRLRQCYINKSYRPQPLPKPATDKTKFGYPARNIQPSPFFSLVLFCRLFTRLMMHDDHDGAAWRVCVSTSLFFSFPGRHGSL